MAVSAHENLTPVTAALEEAIHAALEACDVYRDVIDAELASLRASETTNAMLEKRLRQFAARIESITTQVEDGVLDDLNFLTDRLFAVKRTEEGEFI